MLISIRTRQSLAAPFPAATSRAWSTLASRDGSLTQTLGQHDRSARKRRERDHGPFVIWAGIGGLRSAPATSILHTEPLCHHPHHPTASRQVRQLAAVWKRPRRSPSITVNDQKLGHTYVHCVIMRFTRWGTLDRHARVSPAIRPVSREPNGPSELRKFTERKTAGCTWHSSGRITWRCNDPRDMASSVCESRAVELWVGWIHVMSTSVS